MLVDQHAAANNELIQFANNKKVELSAAPPHALRRDVTNLAKRIGKEFDEEFVRNVGIEAHEKDIKKLEKARMYIKDAELKAWMDRDSAYTAPATGAGAKLADRQLNGVSGLSYAANRRLPTCLLSFPVQD